MKCHSDEPDMKTTSMNELEIKAIETGPKYHDKLFLIMTSYHKIMILGQPAIVDRPYSAPTIIAKGRE
jgi:hypothetical protein